MATLTGAAAVVATVAVVAAFSAGAAPGQLPAPTPKRAAGPLPSVAVSSPGTAAQPTAGTVPRMSVDSAEDALPRTVRPSSPYAVPEEAGTIPPEQAAGTSSSPAAAVPLDVRPSTPAPAPSTSTPGPSATSTTDPTTSPSTSRLEVPLQPVLETVRRGLQSLLPIDVSPHGR